LGAHQEAVAPGHHPTKRVPDVDLNVTLTHPQLLGILSGAGLAGVDSTGDSGVLATLMGLTDAPDPSFAIVTP
jgi:hypothetical protein